MAFAHLHVHTQYSFLDGAIKVSQLATAARSAGMGAIAMTDRSNLYGAVEFQKAADKAGVKPIFGCEVLVVEGDRTDPQARRVNPLVLLAESDVGYRNLIAVVSTGWLDGWHHDQARLDVAALHARREGLIALSGGLGGAVAQAALRRDMDAARAAAIGLRDLFGADRFFLQVEDIGFEENRRVNEALLEIGEAIGVACVATNNCHYLRAEDARAHAALMCIGLGKSYHGIQGAIPDAMWLKDEAAMRASLDYAPQCVDNAAAVAERCTARIALGNTYLPRYRVPEGATLAGYLRDRSAEGLELRLEAAAARGETLDRTAYEERLQTELEIIISMDFPGYFLIVWDFIRKAKEMGVPVGPGRGSGAGSLVAYALRITDIDPIRYGLLFERFLNPERVSMPDFDIDFCMNERERVIRYVTEKYGVHNVGQIITYGTLKAKACLRDVGRVLGLSFSEVDRIAKLIPDELGITLSQALDKEPRIAALFDEDGRYKELFDMALRLEGLTRHAGMHAAGIVISEEPLWHYVPICRGANGEIVTQYAKDEVEQAGLVKFDFLGLKTLTVIDRAVRLIDASRETPFNLSAVPMDDPKVFELLSSGETTGVFQLESSGFKELMKKLKPDCFEDIVAAVALYRPGPLGTGMVDDFVQRKHGLKAVAYPHPALEQALEETYGVIVYQEQVMSIARTIAGYSLGQADILRRAMGKKKPEEMAKQRKVFLEGAVATDIATQEQAGEIYDLMAFFAGYGFNKSHSAAYALISYQTAYLKAHYPVEFMAALLTCDKDNTDKVVRYISDARAMGITVRPPDVNASQIDFSVDRGAIRFGMSAIKNVGEGAVEPIIAGRGDGPFRTLFDLLERTDLKRLNRRVVEQLVKSGACDCFGQPRHVLFHNIDRAFERGQARARDRATGQTSLFDLFGAADDEAPRDESYLSDCEPWSDLHRLSLEKEAIGFYVSGHPLDGYAAELKRHATHDTSTLDRADSRSEVVLGGVVVAMRERLLKSGAGRMAFVTLEDLRGQVEAIFFSRAFGEAEEALKCGEPLLVTGNVRMEGDEDNAALKLRAGAVARLSDIRREKTRRVTFAIDAERHTPDVVHRLAELCQAHSGACPVTIRVHLDGVGTAFVAAGDGLRVDPSDGLVTGAEQILGRGAVQLRG